MKIEHMLVCCAICGLSSVATAGNVAWTGGAGPQADGTYLWTNTLNWAGGVLPGAYDTIIFSPEGTLVVRPDKKPGDQVYSSFRFESGSTIITENGSAYFYMGPSTTEVFVAAGACACGTTIRIATSPGRRASMRRASSTNPRYPASDAVAPSNMSSVCSRVSRLSNSRGERSASSRRE